MDLGKYDVRKIYYKLFNCILKFHKHQNSPARVVPQQRPAASKQSTAVPASNQRRFHVECIALAILFVSRNGIYLRNRNEKSIASGNTCRFGISGTYSRLAKRV